MNLAFLASYNGSSAHAITDACFNNDIIASPTLLISNNESSKALEWAENKGLKTACFNNTTHPDEADLDEVIANKLQSEKVNMLILSGYMKLIGPRTMSSVNGKVLNIHPALLPRHGGKGMYGRKVHEAVKENNETESGATVHLVNEKYDDGKILAQKKVIIEPSDTAEDIEKKVQAIEPELYISTIQKILKGYITLD